MSCDDDDVGVIELLHDLRFAAEPEDGLGVLRCRGGEELEGHLGAAFPLSGLEDDPHPARAQLVEHHIRPDRERPGFPLVQHRGLVTGQLAELDQGPCQVFDFRRPAIERQILQDRPQLSGIKESALRQRPLEHVSSHHRPPSSILRRRSPLARHPHALERLRRRNPSGIRVVLGESSGFIVGRHGRIPVLSRSDPIVVGKETTVQSMTGFR